MSDRPLPVPVDLNRLREIFQQLSGQELRFVVTRLDCDSDREAADELKINYETVRGWDRKQLVNEAVALMRMDAVMTAMEIRRRNLAKAMMIKVQGLDSKNEYIRQKTATEIIEWEMAKATQPLFLRVDGLENAISKIYGGDDERPDGNIIDIE